MCKHEETFKAILYNTGLYKVLQNLSKHLIIAKMNDNIYNQVDTNRVNAYDETFENKSNFKS